MTDLGNCPNCNAELKKGIFGSNELLDEKKAKAINTFTDNKSLSFCAKCSPSLLKTAEQNRSSLTKKANNEMKADIPLVPVITLQSPHKWEYTVLKLVTAQSATGEGALTEFSTSISEFFGTQSKRLNNKLKNGENICISQLRMEALRAGGHAVIACDIDFAQIGDHMKGLLMVCMAGTAVKLNNIEILPGDMTTVFNRIFKNIANLDLYTSFDGVLDAIEYQ